MKIAGIVKGAGLALLLATLTVGFAGQGLAADYYKGKTLTVIAGYPPGGGVDNEMRLVTQYYSRFIPGHPNVVSKNMPGAGGILLGNLIYTATAPDGLTLAMPGRSGFLLANSIGQKGAKYDLTKFTYVGTVASTNSILWLSKRTGIKSLAELRKARKEIILGGLNARSQNIVVPLILAKYEGFPFRPIHGYPGFHAVLIAMERGEVDGLFSHEGSIQATRPDLITSGAVVPIFQTFPIEKNLPVMDSFVDNPKEKALLTLLSAPAKVGLPILGPPKMNAEATGILRASLQEMAKDKAFGATAKKRGIEVMPSTGEELQAYIAAHLVKVPADVVKEYLSYTKRKKKSGKKKK